MRTIWGRGTGVLCGLLAAGVAFAAQEGARPRPLAAGERVEETLAAGGERSYLVSPTAPGPLRIAVDQTGIDVVVELRDGGGATPGAVGALAAVDAPFDRQGRETLVWEAPAAAPLRIDVRAREKGAPAGRYAIRWEEARREAPGDRGRLEAEQALSEGGEGYLRGGAEARRSALAAYRRAAALWQALGERQEEARALYAAAVLARLVNETGPALELARRAQELWREAGDPLWEGASWNEIGLDLWLQGKGAEARAAFESALALDRGAGERYGEAVALSNLCLLRLPKGELREGLACYAEALPLLRGVGATELEAAALTNVGRAYDVLGEPVAARAAYGEALERQGAIGDRAGEAKTLNNLAVLEEAAGEVEAALARYGRAREIFVELGDARWQARVLGNLGLVYYGTGDLAAARANYAAALPLWRAAGDGIGEAATLTNLGLAADREGRWAEALELHRRALELRRKAGERRGEGLSLTQIGRAQLALRSFPEAREALRSAAEILEKAGDLANESYALRLQAEVLAAEGAAESALPLAERALARARAATSTSDEAQALSTLSEVERALGATPAAIEHALLALDKIEARRLRIGDPALRISYSGFQHRAYERTVDLLLAAHRGRPGAGFDAHALAVSERARARTLLELLDQAGAAPARAGAGPEGARLRELETRLSAKAERLSRLAAGGDPAETERLRQESQTIVQEIDLAEAAVRQRDPEAESRAAPRPLVEPEIRALLGPETVLLVYFLGEGRSALWKVTAEGLETFDLPPRAELEAAARRLHEGWSAYDPGRRGAEAAEAEALGKTLLGPVAAGLAGRRVAVVADGALEYLPFAALPVPGTAAAGEPLLAGHEVVVLPSASVLARERKLLTGRAPAPRPLAVFADPVFDRRDPRVPPAPAAKGVAAEAAEGEAPFERLTASRGEAAAIAALLPAGEAFVALDFDASRERVLGDALAPYRVIHFATHGVLDAEHPALSGLALSTVGREGEPREGFLHLRDVYGLRLAADLVVLSGCRTALGREVRGEGLNGLARGFLSAGVPRVVASLWPVEDRATAALMVAFYRQLWREGKSPAAALRAAQLEVRRERRWRDPYFWAGFVLEGAWD